MVLTVRKSSTLALATGRGDLLLRIVAGTILFMMMGLTVVDVVMRYWFNSSIAGAFEITELLLVILIFAGFPLVSKGDQHVSVDVLERLFSDRIKWILVIVKQAVATAVLGTMSWLLWDRVNLVLDYNDVTAVLHISILPFVCFMFALTVITTLIHFSKLIRAVGGMGTHGLDDHHVPAANRSSDPGSV